MCVYYARPTYLRGITSFKDIESGNYWYGSMRLDELNRTVPGRPGLDNLKQSYSSAVGWARGRLACSHFPHIKHIAFKSDDFGPKNFSKTLRKNNQINFQNLENILLPKICLECLE